MACRRVDVTKMTLLLNKEGIFTMQNILARKTLLFLLSLITTSFAALAQSSSSEHIEIKGSEGSTLSG